MPILFSLFGHNLSLGSASCRGVPPPMRGRLPLPAHRYLLGGVTMDSTGAILAGCSVALYRAADHAFLELVTSDASGVYVVSSGGPAQYYYVRAYLAGSPDVAGTSLNTLVAA